MGKDKLIPDPNQNPYRRKTSPYSSQPPPNVPSSVNFQPSGEYIDFNTQRVCPACGKIIVIAHNFCKFCGVDLSRIEPIGNSDEISKQLAITAATDPDPIVRKEAVDTLGSFKDTKVLGVLTYVLFNDPDEEVRKEAVDELGDLHHPYSTAALTHALKDPSPLVRKEAIEGLKKIKDKTKEKKMKKGTAEEREEKEDKEEKEEIEEDEGLF